jgi:signal peptidase II
VQENQRKNTEQGAADGRQAQYKPPAEVETSGASLRVPLFLAVALLIPLADQIVKWLIISRLSLHESIPVIPGLLQITHIHNSGIAFGFFPGLPRLFMVVTIVSMLVVVYFYLTIRPRTLLVTLGCALILGGAAGNLIDRLHYGYVVDFIDFTFWPAFNVADSSVSVGVTLLLASFVWGKEEIKKHASNSV